MKNIFKILLIFLFLIPNISKSQSSNLLLNDESKHYKIQYQKGIEKEWLNELKKLLDSYHEYLHNYFQLKDDGRKAKTIVFYEKDKFSDYAKKQISNYSENLAGYYSPFHQELVIYYTRRHSGIFFHEAFHQIFHKTFRTINSTPQWINEGFASYTETAYFDGSKIYFPESSARYYRNILLQNKNKIDLEKFFKINNYEWNRSGFDYALGAVLFDFLLNGNNSKYKNLLQNFLKEFQSSQNYSSAYSKTFSKIDLKDLQKSFLNFIE